MIPTIRRSPVPKILKNVILLVYVGVVSGILSSFFLYSLTYVTTLRTNNPILIFGLPFYGLLFGLFLKKIPPYINQGIPYFVKEIDNHDEKVSTLTAPFIFLSSLGTHVFGGSAGREGVGVLMGASAAHILPKTYPTFERMRIHLIYAGVAAGFSSIFGTPLAGLVFAFEIHRFKEVRKYDLFFTTMFSALIADRVTRYLGPAHPEYSVSFNWEVLTLGISCLIGLISGIGALVFYFGMKEFTHQISKAIHSIEWKLFAGGALVSLVIYVFNLYDFAGIGNHIIEKSFFEQMDLSAFFIKCFLTIITLSVGFKGGEVTPLFFMGATLSNSILAFLNFNNYSLNSALGMSALFAAVTNTPIASTIMACELFGWKIGIFAFIACLIAKSMMKNRSIYRH